MSDERLAWLIGKTVVDAQRDGGGITLTFEDASKLNVDPKFVTLVERAAPAPEEER